MATNVVPMDYTLERLRNLVDAGVVSAVKEFLVKNPMKVSCQSSIYFQPFFYEAFNSVFR